MWAVTSALIAVLVISAAGDPTWLWALGLLLIIEICEVLDG